MIFKSCFYDRRPPVITWHLTYFMLAVQEGLPLPCSARHFILPFTFYGAQRAPDLQTRASLSLEAPDLCKSLLRKSGTSPCVVKAYSCWCPSWHFCNPVWGCFARPGAWMLALAKDSKSQLPPNPLKTRDNQRTIWLWKGHHSVVL